MAKRLSLSVRITASYPEKSILDTLPRCFWPFYIYTLRNSFLDTIVVYHVNEILPIKINLEFSNSSRLADYVAEIMSVFGLIYFVV